MRFPPFLCAGLLASIAPAAQAQLPDRTDPAAYSCAEFIGAGTPAARERAERMVYWAAGHVRGRLAEIATRHVHRWSFADFAGHVTRTLFERCPGDPAMSIADVAEQIVRELSDTGISKRWGSGGPP